MSTNRIFASACKPSIIEGAAADSDLLPGRLVDRGFSSGDTLDISAITTGNGGQFLVLREGDETQGGSVDVNYTAGDTAQAIAVKSGELVWVRFATGNNITSKSTPVAAAGTGRFRIGVEGTDFIFGDTEEIVNVTADDTLVLIRAR